MDEGTKKEIEKVAVRTLHDAGICEPPVSIEVVLAHLQLNREFFDIQDPTFHEATHHILPWHRTYFHGDTAQTVDPDWHEQLEAEANFGASAMMFCGPKFTEHANDCLPCWGSIKLLKKTYKKNYVPTLRRYIEHGPDHAMAMLVSTPTWKEKPADQPERWRHCVTSPLFMAQFSSVTAGELLRLVDEHTWERKGGPVGDFEVAIDDDNGSRRVFRGE